MRARPLCYVMTLLFVSIILHTYSLRLVSSPCLLSCLFWFSFSSPRHSELAWNKTVIKEGHCRQGRYRVMAKSQLTASNQKETIMGNVGGYQ